MNYILACCRDGIAKDGPEEIEMRDGESPGTLASGPPLHTIITKKSPGTDGTPKVEEPVGCTEDGGAPKVEEPAGFTADGGDPKVKEPAGSSARAAPPSSKKVHIDASLLKPAREAFLDEQPDWKWEKDAGQWRSYSLSESIMLDQYYEAYKAGKPDGPYIAQVTINKTKLDVDFKSETVKAEKGKARKIKRETKTPDWLSNSYFFEAFTDALSTAGITVDTSPSEMFDFRFVQDFRGVKDDGRKMFRGGKEYLLPVGWKRFAVNVKGQYDDGDNTWLREDDNSWAVAYHGTSAEGLPGILSTGFRVGDRQKFAASTGKGIYCAPEIEVAQHYSKPKMIKNHPVQIVLQMRVKPDCIRMVTDPKATDFEKRYWVITDPEGIRAYGVLIRELWLKDYNPPEFMVFGKDDPRSAKVLEKWKEEVRQQELEKTA